MQRRGPSSMARASWARTRLVYRGVMPTKTWDFDNETISYQLVIDTDADSVVLHWVYKPGVSVAQFEPTGGIIEWTIQEFLDQGSPYRGKQNTLPGRLDVAVRIAVVKYIHHTMERSAAR